MSNASARITDIGTYKSKSKKHVRQSGVLRVNGTVYHLSAEDIRRAKDYLLHRPTRYKKVPVNMRDYTWFTLNLNIGLRAGDLFMLKIKNIIWSNGEIRDSIIVEAQKTKKKQEYPLRPEIQQMLRDWLDVLGDWEADWYLFHPMWPKADPYKHYEVRRANEVLAKMKEELELKKPVGTHSMRKSRARSAYDRLQAKGDPMAMQKVMQMLDHTKESHTRRYLGLTHEEVMEVYFLGDMI